MLQSNLLYGSGLTMEKMKTREGGRSARSSFTRVVSLGVCSALLATGAILVVASPAFALSAPTVTSASPSTLPQGVTSQTVTITGTGFVNTGVDPFAATFSNSGITVTSTAFVSATDATAIISISSVAATGAGNITITNGDGGTGTGTGVFSVTAAPTVASVAPPSLAQNQNLAVVITGSGFETGAVATFSGTGITVNSYSEVNATTEDANITATPTATLGARDVTVTNPDSSTATGTGVFTVTGSGTVTSASPASLAQGATSQVVIITGSGFASGAVATFSGTGITVNSSAYVSSTSETATVTIAANATVGPRNITVTNPDSSAGTGIGVFTVTGSGTISAVTPASLPQGSVGQNLTITGVGFASGAVASFSSAGITVLSTTFVSSTDVTADVTIAPTATLGLSNVTVTNTGGGVASGTGLFTVTGSGTITAVSPASLAQGTTAQNVTITGTGFATGATTAFSGSGITVNSTTFVSATSVTANITIAATATVGARNVTVTDPGGAAAFGTGVFSVTGPLTVTAITPAALARGSVSKSVTITGTGFATGATAAFSSTGITVNSTTFVSATSVTAIVTITATATLGVSNVTVTDPGGAVGAGTGIFTVTALALQVPHATHVNGFAVTGRTVTITITGTGFYGAPKITSNAIGTTAKVAHDSGKLLTVRISTRAKRGEHTLTIRDADGKSCRINYATR